MNVRIHILKGAHAVEILHSFQKTSQTYANPFLFPYLLVLKGADAVEITPFLSKKHSQTYANPFLFPYFLVKSSKSYFM